MVNKTDALRMTTLTFSVIKGHHSDYFTVDFNLSDIK